MGGVFKNSVIEFLCTKTPPVLARLRARIRCPINFNYRTPARPSTLAAVASTPPRRARPAKPRTDHGAPRRAALFLRVSTDEQTADNQRPDVEHLARARGFDVVATYEETASGASSRW
jgi:hypothetical protein